MRILETNIAQVKLEIAIKAGFLFARRRGELSRFRWSSYISIYFSQFSLEILTPLAYIGKQDKTRL